MNQSPVSQPISALPPNADAKALVPIDDAAENADISQFTQSDGFKEFLNKIADHATRQSNSPAQWERRRKTVTLRKYILGYYYGIYDKSRGFISGKQEGDGIYFDPQTPTAIDNLVASLTKTKPQKKCESRSGEERIDKREAARVAQMLLQMDDDQDFTPIRQQREWKWNLLAAGETYRITYFNTNKRGCGIDKPVFEHQTIEGGDTAYHCPLCDSTGSDEAGKCPKCGNPQLDEYKVLGTTIAVNKGSEYQQVGDCDWDAPDALEMTVIGETDEIADALVVLRDRMIPRCVLEDALGISDLPRTDIPDALSYKQLFDSKDSASKGDLPAFEPLHYQELWVSPVVVASYKFPSDTAMHGGKVAKATKAKEMFPNGLYFSRIKKRICEVFPQSIGEVLTHAVNSIGESFHGQGEWDLIELQDQATEAKSMKMNSMLLDSTQPMVIRDGYIDTENFENKFGLIVPVSQDYPMDAAPGNLMWRIPAGRAPQEAYSLGEEIKGEIQQREGTFSTQSDAPDVKAMGTATGIAAIQQQALGRRGPALQLYAQMEVEQAYQKLELRQKYWCRKMYDPIAKQIGGDAIKWFMDCNIRQDINISVVAGSWMPQTTAEKQDGLKSFLEIAGQIIAAKGDPKLMDDVLRQANELFGAGIDFGNYETESIEAQLRLDKLRDIAAFIESQFGEFLYAPDGTISDQAILLAYQHTAQILKVVHVTSDAADIFANLPLDVMFDTHSEFENAYVDWLKTSEGRAASEFTRTLVRNLADYHVQAETYRQLKLKQYANVTQLPDLQANLVENDAMNSQAQAHAAQAAEQMAATAPPNAEPYPPHPMQKVSETINYKDAPDAIKRQIEAAAGMQPAYNAVTPPEMPEQDKVAAAHDHATSHKLLDLADRQAQREHDLRKTQDQAPETAPKGHHSVKLG